MIIYADGKFISPDPALQRPGESEIDFAVRWVDFHVPRGEPFRLMTREKMVEILKAKRAERQRLVKELRQKKLRDDALQKLFELQQLIKQEES